MLRNFFLLCERYYNKIIQYFYRRFTLKIQTFIKFYEINKNIKSNIKKLFIFDEKISYMKRIIYFQQKRFDSFLKYTILKRWNLILTNSPRHLSNTINE